MTARVGGLREKVAAPEGLHAGTEFVLIGGRALQWKGADVVPLGVQWEWSAANRRMAPRQRQGTRDNRQRR